jgi:hypothetical protein
MLAKGVLVPQLQFSPLDVERNHTRIILDFGVKTFYGEQVLKTYYEKEFLPFELVFAHLFCPSGCSGV